MIYLSRKVIPNYLQVMALAIFDWEGGSGNDLNVKNNNPGNLKFAGQSGAIGKDKQGHAIFDTFENGWNALIKQLQISFDDKSKNFNSAMTLYQFFAVYAEANTRNYAEFVANRLGVSPNATLKNIKETLA